MRSSACILSISALSLAAVFGQTSEVVEKEELPTLEAIYRSYLEANGGLVNINAVNSIIVNGRIEKEGSVRPFKLYRKRPDLMRMSVEYENYAVDTRYDGEEIRQELVGINGKTRQMEMEPGAAERVKRENTMEGPFFHLGRDLRSLSLEGEESIRGVNCYRIAVNERAGSPIRKVWLSQENYQEVKILEEVGSYLQSAYYSDFERVDGLLVATTVEYRVDQELSHRIYVDSVKTNPGVFDAYFDH